MQGQGQSYDTIYGVGFLDDLHNYFPAILYEPGRFQSVPQLLQYIRHQTAQRFNLFTYGSMLYEEGQNQHQPPITARSHIHQQGHLHRFDPEELSISNMLFNMLGSSINPATLAQTRRFMQPVVVSPSQQALQTNTEIITDISGSICTICQDSILMGENCRRLIPCRHVYHRTCIDTWFQTNVHCPTCRHDIRERAISTQRAE